MIDFRTFGCSLPDHKHEVLRLIHSELILDYGVKAGVNFVLSACGYPPAPASLFKMDLFSH